jgi:hypothetical protein
LPHPRAVIISGFEEELRLNNKYEEAQMKLLIHCTIKPPDRATNVGYQNITGEEL